MGEMLSDAILTSGALTHPDTYDHLQLIVPKILSKNISADFLVNVYKPKWVTYVSLPTFILTHNDILKDAEAAYEDARYLCEQHYISSPTLEVDKGSNVNTIFPSIPNYNYLILFGIFKNAMRATMEEHGEDNEESPPPVMLRVREDGFRLVIEVADKGGGMSEEQQIKAMKFFSSTAVLADMSTYQGAISSPLAGHGFGLGVARLYCSYWGGDLNIRARKGSGATVRMEWCTEPALASENF